MDSFHTGPLPFRCNRKMDVVFVVDETMSSEWLNNTKMFMGGLGDGLHIDQDYTRSVIVPYGTEGASVRFFIGIE